MLAELRAGRRTSARWIEPRLLVLLGIGETPAGGREELFAAWRTFFERMAEPAPTPLVFEDLHWADDGLLDFIEHLLDWAATCPIFVARPWPGPSCWTGGRAGAPAGATSSRCALEPLSEPAMRELLHGLVPGLPDSGRRSDPRAGRRHPALRRRDGADARGGRAARAVEGALRPVGDLADLEVPETLHALIAARLDALARRDVRCCRTRPCSARRSRSAALAAVAQMGPTTCRRARPLARREILRSTRIRARRSAASTASSRRWSARSPTQTLAKRDRRAKHLAAARYFESLGDEELAGVAGHPVPRRGTLRQPDGPEGGVLAAQARVALRAAADRATALHSLPGALELSRPGVDGHRRSS